MRSEYDTSLFLDLVEAFAATSLPWEARAFVRKQLEALGDFGCDLGLTEHPAWLDDPDVFLIVVRAPATGELIGGVRLHLRHAWNRIALEDTFDELDPSVCARISAAARTQPLAEFSSLWVDRRYRGGAISRFLMSAVVAVAMRLGARRGITFCSPQSEPVIQGLGFEPDLATGIEGKFEYPDSRYLSCLMWCDLSPAADMAWWRAQQVLALHHSSLAPSPLPWVSK